MKATDLNDADLEPGVPGEGARSGVSGRFMTIMVCAIPLAIAPGAIFAAREGGLLPAGWTALERAALYPGFLAMFMFRSKALMVVSASVFWYIAGAAIALVLAGDRGGHSRAVKLAGLSLACLGILFLWSIRNWNVD